MFYENEMDKMAQEDRVAEIKAKAYINEFANSIRKLDKSALVAKPQKMKIPFRTRVRRLFDKLNKALG